MSEEKITSTREAMIAEILGNVSGLEEQVKLLRAELVDSNKKMKEQYEQSKQALFLSRTEAVESIQREAAKQVREGVFSETDNLKRSLTGLTLKIQQETEELAWRLRKTFIAYVIFGSFGVSLATFLVEKVIMTH